MSTDTKTPRRRPSVRKSMEVQHGSQGVGRMLRRGLHGAKNWVLETDESGAHRTVGSKAFRAAVTLAPGWIILSAFTGSSQRGGGQMGGVQAVLLAVLVTLVGLAVFSSRERRLGREEPWAESETPEEAPDRASDGIGSEGRENAERPTEILENPQVSEVTTLEQVVTQGDNAGEKDHFDHPEPQVVTEVVTEAVTQTLPTTRQDEVFDQVRDQVTTPEEVVTPVVTQAVTPAEMEIEYLPISDILEEETPPVRLEGDHPDPEVVTKGPEEVVNPQVSSPDQVVTQGSDETSKVSLEKPKKEDPTPPPPPVVTEPVTPVVIRGTQVPMFPQVKKDEEVVTKAVTPVVTKPSYAKAGPYKPTSLPLSDDWWAVRPDLPEAEPEPVENIVEDRLESSPQAVEPEPVKSEEATVVEVEPKPMEKAEAEVEPLIASEPTEPLRVIEGRAESVDDGLPREVLAYLALGRAENLTKDAKDKIRRDAIAWVRREIQAERLSQRPAAQLLQVSKTTIANWLADDPWTVIQEDEDE